MKLGDIEFPNKKNTPLYSSKKLILLSITTFVLTTITLYFCKNSSSSWQSSANSSSQKNLNSTISSRLNQNQKCDIFSGNWVPYPKGPYYTNATKCVIDDRQNCMKFGRPDTEFMKWRWKPDKCELPLFDADRFLALVRGKSMAFVGDSIARGQMQSLVCLLTSVATPQDVSYIDDTRFRRWFYEEYNFTLAALWSTHLVKASNADPGGYSMNSLMNLHLDEADESWATQVEQFDYVIISAGQWFSRPFVYYQNGKVVGCHNCDKENITSLTKYYGYRMAFRTTFRTLISLQNFKGVTFLRTFSPPHFENGDWDKGGNCVRKRPFRKQELKVDWYVMEFYLTQMEELKRAERIGRNRGLKFDAIGITEVMLLRPDGHPNHYGHWPHQIVTIADCVHWCLPGPIDTWNEFLLQMLKTQSERFNV